MPGVSSEQHLFSGSSSCSSVFGNRCCPVSRTFESQDPPKSFYAETPEFSPTNIEYLQSLNLFSSETSPNSEKSRYSKDSVASVQKLFNKSLSFGNNSLGIDLGFTNQCMESENLLVSPRTVIESPDGISSLHKFLPSNNEEEASWPAVDAYSCDEFRMYEFKVRRCMRGRSHDWTECPFAHPGEKARRRDPRRFHYSGTGCPDFRKGSCRRGDACEYAHGVFECWLHPARYRTQPCKDGRNCRRRVCFFAHTPEQLRLLPGASQAQSHTSPNFGNRNSFQMRNAVNGSYDGSPLRYAVSAAASSLDGAFGYDGFDGNASPRGHLNYLCKAKAKAKASQISSPTSTLVGHSYSPPPLSPPLSPSASPPISPDSCLNYANSPVKSYPNSDTNTAPGSFTPRRHLEKLISIPPTNLDPSTLSPAEHSTTQSSKLIMESLINSLQRMEINRETPLWFQQQQQQSNLPRRSCLSFPYAPRWDEDICREVEAAEDGAIERVESGKDLRAKIYGRLARESALQDSNNINTENSPDLGWVNELVM